MKQLIILIIFLYTSSCKKFVETPLPANELLTETVFTDDATTNSAIAGLYSQIMTVNNSFLNAATTIYPALSADELYNTNTSGELDEFTLNELLPSNSIINSHFWTRGYRFIYHANSIIEQANKSTTLSPAVKDLVLGEALFMRALSYYYLSALFGDVPLVLNTDFNTNAIIQRTAFDLVHQQIITDLIKAIELLPVTYTTTDRTRPNKYTALALLARLHLWKEQWSEAEQVTTTIINSNIYSLITNLNNVFIATSPETIWQLLPVLNLVNTAEGITLIAPNATARPVYALTNNLWNAFEPNDNRKNTWTKTNTVSGVQYPYPYKYKVRTSNPKTEYNIVFRLAETYLVRAEARAQQNKLTDAASDLNKIRNRAGLPNSTASTKDSLLMAIEQERRIELFVEWGHRWLDLQRTNRATTLLSPLKPNWQPTDNLYPVPLFQINRNPFLSQNPGY